MTPVEFHFITPSGDPIVGATVEIQLAKSSADAEDNGILMPRLITAITERDGKVTVPLESSSQIYHVVAVDPLSEASLYYKARVPDLGVGQTFVRFQDIVDTSAPDVPYDQQILLMIQAARDSAIAAAAAAATSAAALSGSALVAALDTTIGGVWWKTKLRALANGVSLGTGEVSSIDVRGTGATATLVNGVLIIDFTGGGTPVDPTPGDPSTGSISLEGAGALYMVGAGLINLV